MKLINSPYTLEPHGSGKKTCYIATITHTGEKFFVKMPRTIDNVNEGLQEIFAELLGEEIFSAVGVDDIGSQLQNLGFQPAIVQRYHPKNWTNSTDQGVEIVNYHEWPLFLAAETLMRQTDRSPGKPEHVGLSLIEGVGLKYRGIPLDLGNAFVGYPSGYQGLDEDLNPEFLKTLFWSTRDSTRAELEDAITRLEEIAMFEVVYKSYRKIEDFSTWSTPQLTELKKHIDRVLYFLQVRIKKLRAVLLSWWDQEHPTAQASQTNVLQAQSVI